MWPTGNKPSFYRLPTNPLPDRMVRNPGAVDWGLYWYPIPDPYLKARQPFFPEGPIVTGMARHVADYMGPPRNEALR